MSELANFEHGGNIHALARQSGTALAAVLDFSANINPLGLAASVRQAIADNLESVIHYPDPTATALKQAISHHYQVPVAGITAGNGAVELLYVLCHCHKPQRVLVTAPTFSEYERAARAAGAAVEYFPLSPATGFQIDTEELGRRLTGIDMVFVCNPNNPTGALLARQELERLLAVARRTATLVVVDESFLDFLPAADDITCRPLLAANDNLVIVHSLTKFYAVPGLRLGFVLTAPVWTERLHLAKDPWNVNSLAQAAGVAALNDHEYQAQSRTVLAEARDQLYEQLRLVAGCRPYPPSVNYILVNIAASGLSSRELRRQLAADNLMIRDCANYPGLSADYIRLAVKLPEQNKRLVAALQRVLAESGAGMEGN